VLCVTGRHPANADTIGPPARPAAEGIQLAEASMPDIPLLLVDGHNLLFRSCFSVPAQIWSRDEDDRRDLTTEFMFFALLRKGINEELPGWPEVVVVFDGQDGSAQRKESDADYKANRSADGEALEPIRALPAVKAALDLFGISWVERLLGRQRVGPPGRGEGKLGALPGAGV
jgi:hypothetical protein